MSFEPALVSVNERSSSKEPFRNTARDSKNRQKATLVIRQTQEETIYRLLAALESRDDETGGHVRRIALFSMLLAEAVKWSEGELEDLRLAAPMHDIGKIGVPDAILRKPGPLSKEEYRVMKNHTTIGGQILSGSQFPMLQMAHDIAVSHHEKWDGSGYPNGLSGDAIPLVGRIVSLVDVYDALSHDRVYHKALAEQEVLAIMFGNRAAISIPISSICLSNDYRILKPSPKTILDRRRFRNQTASRKHFPV